MDEKKPWKKTRRGGKQKRGKRLYRLREDEPVTRTIRVKGTLPAGPGKRPEPVVVPLTSGALSHLGQVAALGKLVAPEVKKSIKFLSGIESTEANVRPSVRIRASHTKKEIASYITDCVLKHDKMLVERGHINGVGAAPSEVNDDGDGRPAVVIQIN